MMNIYFDTNLWDELLDQAISIPSLHQALTLQQKRIVLSDQILFELAQALTVNYRRGLDLFECVKIFSDFGVTVAHSIQELLHREANACGQRIEPFATDLEYQKFLLELNALASGTIKPAVQEDVALRQQSVPINREGQKQHLSNRVDKRKEYRSVPESQLQQWMTSEMKKPEGIALLAGHLNRLLGMPLVLAALCAQKLIASPSVRLAKGLVRADLYFNWRCANRGSIRKDLQPDMHHVLTASYCEVYATKEANHAEYAHLLSAETRVCIYGGQTPFDQWLLALV